MKFVVQFFGFLLVLAGIGLLIYPDFLFAFLENNEKRLWLYLFAIIVRLVLGLFLIFSAHQSKYPGAIKIIGFLVLVLAVTLIFIGRETFQSMISSVIPMFEPYGRAAGAGAIVLGAFLVHAYSKTASDKQGPS